MSFVAAPPTVPPPAAADLVAGDGWYPALSVAAFRDVQRVPAQVTTGRAREALIGGIASADAALAGWGAQQQAAGAATLAAAGDGRQLAGEPRSVVLWRRAVFAFAAADLVETHGEISATEAGRDRREIRAASADDLRRSATVAIRDLLGRPRTRVRLV